MRWLNASLHSGHCDIGPGTSSGATAKEAGGDMRNELVTPVRPAQAPELAALASLLSGVIVVAVLYLARDALIPLALAILISFVLAPMARGLRRLGLPRVPAVVAVVGLTFGAILGIGALGTTQISQLAEQLPQYQANIREKIRTLKGATNSSVATRATSVIEDIGREISGSKSSQTSPATQPLGAKDGAPVPVEIRPSTSNPLKVAAEFLQPIISPLATTGLVILFVIFILLQREDLRDRVIKLLGTRALNRTTEAMDEAATRLSRYFLLQTALNAGFGLIVGLGLWVIGVPSPLLWGIFTMLMRFVPYVGSLLAAVLPVALAAAVDPGWSMVLWTLALFMIGEPVMGHLIEPMVFGRQTGLSPIAIVIAATFWTWLWGPIGLIVATPLTLCLVLLGQYTTRLEFLHVMLGDQPPLTPAESFYQRLIAGDAIEIIEQAETQLKDRPLVAYYDDVAMQGLALAQRDANSGELTGEKQALLYSGVMDLVDGLSDSEDPVIENIAVAEPGTKKALDDDGIGGNVERGLVAGSEQSQAKPAPSVLCIAGRGFIDQSAAALLVQVLDRAGVSAWLGSDHGPQGLSATQKTYPDVPLICLSYVGMARSAQVRFMVRRTRRIFPKAKIMIGLWPVRAGDPEVQQIKDTSDGDQCASSLHDVVTLCTTDTAWIAAASAKTEHGRSHQHQSRSASFPRANHVALTPQEG
jgi:predicted PurR-regulated permease PerM